MELVSDMTTDRFFGALAIISMYGQPKFMRSANGIFFVGPARDVE